MSDTVRDLRGGSWAWFSKAVLKMKLGWKANLVYMGLVAFANNDDQTCFPSKSTLAEMLGVSKTTVYQGLQLLKTAGLVGISERKNGDTSLSNEYTLLPLPHAQYAPPTRNTNEDPIPNTDGVVRIAHANKIQEKDLKGDKSGLVPVNQDSGSEIQIAVWIFHELGIPSDFGTRNVAAQAVQMLAKEKDWKLQESAQFILDGAKAAKKEGETINRFWFTDQKYIRKKPEKKDPFANMKFINGGNK